MKSVSEGRRWGKSVCAAGGGRAAHWRRRVLFEFKAFLSSRADMTSQVNTLTCVCGVCAVSETPIFAELSSAVGFADNEPQVVVALHTLIHAPL